MKVLVVFESMWGNTGQVAQAIAAGIGQTCPVEVVDVEHAPAQPGTDVTLIVAGGPTHAFSMSKSSTRAAAHRQGATHGSEAVGIREWLDALPGGHHSQAIATFDTRVGKVRHLPGSAAKRAAKVASRHGYQRTDHAQSFFVADSDGPLLDGELDRATQWGRLLAGSIRPSVGR